MIHSLDTNLLVRWIVRDDPKQSQFVDKLLSSGKNFQVADLTIAELVFVLSKFYGLSNHVVAACVQKIIDHKYITCNKTLFSRVINDFSKASTVSFVDICLVHYASLQNGKLITFDKALAKKYFDQTELAG